MANIFDQYDDDEQTPRRGTNMFDSLDDTPPAKPPSDAYALGKTIRSYIPDLPSAYDVGRSIRNFPSSMQDNFLEQITHPGELAERAAEAQTPEDALLRSPQALDRQALAREVSGKPPNLAEMAPFNFDQQIAGRAFDKATGQLQQPDTPASDVAQTLLGYMPPVVLGKRAGAGLAAGAAGLGRTAAQSATDIGNIFNLPSVAGAGQQAMGAIPAPTDAIGQVLDATTHQPTTPQGRAVAGFSNR